MLNLLKPRFYAENRCISDLPRLSKRESKVSVEYNPPKTTQKQQSDELSSHTLYT
jgi:hypothetical protein